MQVVPERFSPAPTFRPDVYSVGASSQSWRTLYSQTPSTDDLDSGPSWLDEGTALWHGTLDLPESATASSDLICGRLVADDTAWGVLEAAVGATWTSSEDLEARLSSLSEWLSVGFLVHEGLLNSAPFGLGKPQPPQMCFLLWCTW